jgi:hypothetical protein
LVLRKATIKEQQKNTLSRRKENRIFMSKNRIQWIVEGCSTGDTIIVNDGARSTKITVLALYGRCLMGKTRYGSPMTVNYASLYAQQSGVSAVNDLTGVPVRVRPDLPGLIRCREKGPGKAFSSGRGRAGRSSSGPRRDTAGDRPA